MTITLFRPVGPKELALIEASDYKEFPPRLLGQPIFYPVTNEEYAIQIARDWNVKDSGSGYVTRFKIAADYAARFPKKIVGGLIHEELWIPAEELAEFNSKIQGAIEVIHRFPDSKNDATVGSKLEGTWRPVYAEMDGGEAPKMMLDKMEIELVGGEYAVRFGGVTADQGTYVVDAGGLTLFGMIGPNAGKAIPCLFKFVGEMLSVCYGLSGTRPDKFTTAQDQQRYLANYVRK